MGNEYYDKMHEHDQWKADLFSNAFVFTNFDAIFNGSLQSQLPFSLEWKSKWLKIRIEKWWLPFIMVRRHLFLRRTCVWSKAFCTEAWQKMALPNKMSTNRFASMFAAHFKWINFEYFIFLFIHCHFSEKYIFPLTKRGAQCVRAHVANYSIVLLANLFAYLFFSLLPLLPSSPPLLQSGKR